MLRSANQWILGLRLDLCNIQCNLKSLLIFINLNEEKRCLLVKKNLVQNESLEYREYVYVGFAQTFWAWMATTTKSFSIVLYLGRAVLNNFPTLSRPPTMLNGLLLKTIFTVNSRSRNVAGKHEQHGSDEFSAHKFSC